MDCPSHFTEEPTGFLTVFGWVPHVLRLVGLEVNFILPFAAVQ
jgi:hypothetical protein